MSPAYLIRELILKEMRITVPHAVAGRNIINYDRNKDSFTWSVELDTGKTVEVLRNVSPVFVENLNDIITLGMGERTSFLRKKREDSVPVPSNILRRKRQ
ncbi:MAG TPA: hypothetical protein VJ249_03735 [Candidatus Bathyarchaeia archaeon]|nr:hypothetical protein [Candidatus Bathyarchaeia archaeon]